MTRAKTKSVTMDNIKHCAAPGGIELRACNDPDRRGYKVKGIQKEDAITMEINHCMAFFGRNEALQMVVSTTHAAAKQWGTDFITDVERLLEGMRGQ